MDSASKARQRAVRARRHVGLSQKDVAMAIGITINKVSAYERGLVDGKDIDLTKYAKICGVTVHWLYTGLWEKGTKPPAKRYSGDLSPQMSARLSSMQNDLDALRALVEKQTQMLQVLVDSQPTRLADMVVKDAHVIHVN